MPAVIGALQHPLLEHIQGQSFTTLGWFQPGPGDGVPSHARCVVLIGNAGPDMFRRFERERDRGESLDDWTSRVIAPMAAALGADALYPFGTPPPPFLTWGRRAGAGHVSPLGLNVHPVYGLWHAYRAALLFRESPDLPPAAATPHPCMSCTAKPCLQACPVSAFNGSGYEVERCVDWLGRESGRPCMTRGCQSRLACPLGQDFAYEPAQIQFHMLAFRSRMRAV